MTGVYYLMFGLPVTGADDSYFLQVSCKTRISKGNANQQKRPVKYHGATFAGIESRFSEWRREMAAGHDQSVSWTGNYFGGANINVTLLEKNGFRFTHLLVIFCPLASDKYTCF